MQRMDENRRDWRGAQRRRGERPCLASQSTDWAVNKLLRLFSGQEVHGVEWRASKRRGEQVLGDDWTGIGEGLTQTF